MIAPLPTQLPASYTTWRDIRMYRGASHTFLSAAKQTQFTSHRVFVQYWLSKNPL